MKTKKIFILLLIIVVIAIIGLIAGNYKEQIKEALTNETTKTVEEALQFYQKNYTSFNSESSASFLSLFSSQYKDAFFSLTAMERFLYGESKYDREDHENLAKTRIKPRIYITSWKLDKQRITDENYVVTVIGTTGNLVGLDGQTNKPIYEFDAYPKKVKFILNKIDNEWVITDSYNFFLFKALCDSSLKDKSDLEKSEILNQLLSEIQVKILDLKIIDDMGYYFTINCNGFIKNNSFKPICYACLRINLESLNNESENTYTFVNIIDNNEIIEPSQRKNFSLEENVYLHQSACDISSLFNDSRKFSYNYNYRLILE